jgi:hypothetical protein
MIITRGLLVAVAILVCASPAFTQFDRYNNNRLNDLAQQLSREANEFADQNYRSYVGGTRNLRRDIEAAMNSQQFAASAELFNRMVTDRRQRADLRDAFEMVRTAANSVERYNLQRNTWSNLQRLMSDISRELGSEGGGGGGGGQYPPDTGRGGRMTWRGRVDDDVRIRIRGGSADVETVGGTQYDDGQANFFNSLPNRRVTVRLTSQRGRGQIFVEQQPSRENDFTAIVRIKDTRGGASDYEFELTW